MTSNKRPRSSNTNSDDENELEDTTSTLQLFSSIAQLESADAQSHKNSRTATKSAIAKAKAAKSQLELHHKLIEMRILLQRVIQHASEAVAASEHEDTDLEQENRSDSEEEDQEKTDLTSIVNSGKNMLQQLQVARQTMLQHSPVLSNNNEQDSSNSQDSYAKCRDEQWKPILNQRQHNLRLRSGTITMKLAKKFQVVDQTFWDQIQGIMAHERLLNSTKTTQNYQDGDNKIALIYNDGKVYQNMLKDFIAASTTTNTSSNSASDTIKAMQARLQKQAKSKKKVDRKASKGRKIRYNIHDKLANFTFPVMRQVPAIQEDVWFKTLFGRNM